MHNIDRTLQEFDSGAATNGEFESYETNGEYGHETSGEYGHEMGQEFGHEFGHEMSGESFEMNNEEQQFLGGLVSQLFEVNNEQELNMFLGSLIKKAGRGISKFAKSSVGRAIGGALKAVAKKVIPIAGGALGTFVGGPLGGMVGSKLGSMASNLFELELET